MWPRDKCVLLQICPNPELLLDLLSLRSGGWKPHGRQQGVEFHEGD